MIDYHFIYLIKEKRYIDEEKEIYKIGKSTQENTRRVKSYPSGSKLYLQIRCINCHEMERKLISIFNDTFNLVRGREYFLGEIKDMMDIVYNEIRDEYYFKEGKNYSTMLDDNTELLKENSELDRQNEKLVSENKILKYENEKNIKEINRLCDTINVDLNKIDSTEIENKRLLHKIFVREDELKNMKYKYDENINELRYKYNEDMKSRDNIIIGYTKTVEYLEDEMKNYKIKDNDKDKELERIKNMIEYYKNKNIELENSKNSYRYIDLFSIYNFVTGFILYPIKIFWRNCYFSDNKKDKEEKNSFIAKSFYDRFPSFIS